MIRVEVQKWGQSLEDLRSLAFRADHPRTRERFLALSQIADGTHNATTWAARFGRQDETVLGWLHTYNTKGPDALNYRHTGGHCPPFAPDQARQLLDAVATTEPVDHNLPGHGWTLKKLRRWVLGRFGRLVGTQRHPSDACWPPG